jgi:hypothetical protein
MNLVERLRQGDFTAVEVLEAADQIERLTAELAECRKDSARIDWISRQDFDGIYFAIFQDHPYEGKYGVSSGSGYAIGDSFRDALDGAMKEASCDQQN